MQEWVISPSPRTDWTELHGEVRLSRLSQKQGRLFEKEILRFGDLIHPVTGQKIKIDKAFTDTLVSNFEAGFCDIVQVPLANDQNQHVENPGANLGEVLGLRVDEAAGKVYAQVDARKQAEDFGKTLLGASAFMHLNYKDTKTGQRVGPTLLHVAVTNRPYVTGLDPYQEIVAASSEYDGEPALLEMSATTDQEEAAVPRTLQDILAELKADHNVDVDALQTALSAAETKASAAEAKASEQEVALSSAQEQLAAKPDLDELVEKVRVALSGTGVADETKLSADGDVTTDDIVSAVATLAQDNVKLTSANEANDKRIAALERRHVEGEIDALIGEGKILPAKREVFLTMALTNREMFDQILPDEPLVKLGNELGSGPSAEAHQTQEVDIEAEIARLTGSGGPAAQYIGA